MFEVELVERILLANVDGGKGGTGISGIGAATSEYARSRNTGFNDNGTSCWSSLVMTLESIDFCATSFARLELRLR